MKIWRWWIIALFALVAGHAQAEVRRPKIPANADASEIVEALLSIPEEEIDLTWSKLVFDHAVDPSVDIDATLERLDALATKAKELAGLKANAPRKVAALRTVIYKPGPWNGNTPFDYDFDDPNGILATHKTLAWYLQTKRGNCVNMPILFLAVSERMGVTMNITTAPRHVFLQFANSDTGKIEHLEATSGAQPQRIVWQRQVLPMTDRAIESGMYMKRLSKRQQVAVMAEILLHHLGELDEQAERIEVAELILKEFPELDVALLNLADAYRLQIQKRFASVYPTTDSMPLTERVVFEQWASAHDKAVDLLAYLGWQRAQATEFTSTPGQGKPSGVGQSTQN